MTLTDFFNGTGEFFESSFWILEAGGNYVNYGFMVGGFVLFIYWLRRQANHNKKADANSTLK